MLIYSCNIFNFLFLKKPFEKIKDCINLMINLNKVNRTLSLPIIDMLYEAYYSLRA